MNIDSLNSLDGVLSRRLHVDALPLESGVQSPSSDSFAAWLSREIDAVNSGIHESDALVQKLAVGETDNIHQVMIALEKVKLQFELLVQVRNKLLEGYQEVMRMQV